MSAIAFLDLGNTCIKAVVYNNGRWGEVLRLVHSGKTSSVLQELLVRIRAEKVSHVYAASVADVDFMQLLLKELSAEAELKVQALKPQEKVGASWVSSYEKWNTLGVDRMLAMLGGQVENDCALCVVDMGTATTIDFISREGVHEGGYIVPGLSLQLKSVFKETSNIETSSVKVGSVQPANNTVDAVHRGCVVAQVALIEYLFLEHSKHLNDTCRLLLTGGDAATLGQFIKAPYVYDEMLVFKGMLFMSSLGQTDSYTGV